MHKRGQDRYVKSAAFSEIFILIAAIFALAVVLNESSLVSAGPDGKTKDTGTQGPASSSAGTAASAALALKSTGGATGASWIAKPAAGYDWSQFGITDSIGYRNNPATGKLQFWSPKDKSWLDSTYGSMDEVKGGGSISGFDKTGGAATEGGGLMDWWFGSVSGTGGAALGQHLAQGVLWGAIAYGAGMLVGSMLGFDEEQTQALSTALAGGVFAGKAAAGIAQYYTESTTAVAWAGWVTGIVVGAAIFLYMYKKEDTIEYKFTCEPYEPPIGGADCEKCNVDPMRPCTEYRCRALGQACQLLNKEKPGEEKCAWINPKDVNSPTITPWVGVLSPQGLKYVEDKSIRPPALGVKIVRTVAPNGCLQAYTPLVFGITTNEPAQCRVDTNHTANFDAMNFYLGESGSFSYNHTQRMKLPGPDAINETEIKAGGGVPLLKNDGTMQIFVRCRDANNNSNVDEYSVKFCVDPSPDTTPPYIESTSIISGSPVRFGADNVYTEFYVNEPAECKWSIQDKSYGDMENNMSCALTPGEINAQLSYTCATNLTGVKNDAENKYFIRCKDKPDKADSERNVMTQSYPFSLKGSQQLNIIRVGPNGTISGSTDSVNVDLEVETDDGSSEGRAFCYFSGTGANDSYIQMFETDSFRHKQTLQLTSGAYTFYYKCLDWGGNSAENSTTFSVLADKYAPVVSRIYKDAVGLKVVTNEDAECVYSLVSCNYVFADGLAMIYDPANMVRTNSYAEWKPNTVYYIKCRDSFGNEPTPNECSVIARPVETFKKAE